MMFMLYGRNTAKQQIEIYMSKKMDKSYYTYEKKTWYINATPIWHCSIKTRICNLFRTQSGWLKCL